MSIALSTSRDSHSVSSFLRSYEPDCFEWETPGYCPRARFLWTKALSDELPTSPRERTKSSSEDDCVSEYDALSDMSMSFSDISSMHFSVLPPMNRARLTPAKTMSHSKSLESLSDMSLSSFSASESSNGLGYFETLSANVSSTTSKKFGLGDTVSISSLLQDSHQDAHYRGENGADKLDDLAVGNIVEWTTSLFASVASSAMDYSIHPGVDDFPQSSNPQILDNGIASFSATTNEMDIRTWLPSTGQTAIKLNSSQQKGTPKHILANHMSIIMPGAVEYEALSSEQPTTAKAVCMWGRRLERIPKVRLAGQKEAVYCFDARKQRQKQKSNAARSSSSTPPTEQPTQIFYRARPLYAPFVQQNISNTPVDAVKVSQGKVLLQNVRPVRFDEVSPPGGSLSFQRLPLTPRTNGVIHDFQKPKAQKQHTPPRFLGVKKTSQPGFL